MASVSKPKGRPYYVASFRDGVGRQHFRTTGTADKRKAEEIARVFERTSRLGADRFTPERAREIVGRVVGDLFADAHGAALPGSTVRAWAKDWLDGRQHEVAPSTLTRYRDAVDRLLTFLGKQADADLSTLRRDQLARWRDRMAGEISVSSANFNLKVARVWLGAAVKRGALGSNPATGVDVLRRRVEGGRRPFTVEEVRRILGACHEREMRGLVLVSFYLGLRLGDAKALTWRAVDLEAQTLCFVARKTSARLALPLPVPVLDFLAELPAGDNPTAAVFPGAARMTVAALGKRFRRVLVDAGLVPPRDRAVKAGRSGPREGQELSFHSLRHSAVSALKATGSSDALAAALVGHKSAAVNQGYTKFAAADLRAAVDRLPDVTAGLEDRAK